MAQEYNENELNAFLAELERTDPGSTGLTQEQIDAINKMETKDLEKDMSEEDVEKLTSDNAWIWARKDILEDDKVIMGVKEFIPLTNIKANTLQYSHDGKELQVKKNAERLKRARDIKLEALHDVNVDLYKPLTLWHKQMVIRLLTKKYNESLIKCNSYLKAKAMLAMSMIMPRDLRECYKKYREAFIPMPSFVYTATKEFGQEQQYEFHLDLPYYFSSEIMPKIFRKALIIASDVKHYNLVFHLDKNIMTYNKVKSQRDKREIAVAKKLIMCNTFMDLIDLDAFWYDALITELKAREDEGLM